MHLVEDEGPDTEAMAKELMEPLLVWLASVSLTPARFTEVMRSDASEEEKLEQLGINQQQFKEGINSIRSLHLYGLILGITEKDVWIGFEANRYIAPQWVIDQAEELIREHTGGVWD